MKVIFVSLDTLRADRLTILGGERSLTPNLDRIAAEGTIFSNAFSSDIPTQPSHTALFTGRFGIHTDIVSHFHPASQLDPREPWLPTRFHRAGYATGAVDHLFAMKDWFVRGYDDYMPPPGRSRSPGSIINEIGFPWMATHRDADFFLFLHFWDAHIPYVPPSPYKERYTQHSAGRADPQVERRLRSRPTYPLFAQNLYDHIGPIPNLDYVTDLYDAEVAYLDHEIGRLFDHVAELGIADDTMIVLFGDHGENMTEHDAWFDHAGLYDSVVHVPLIIWAPGLVPAMRSDAFVQLVDVAPTVHQLLGWESPPDSDGSSLVPVMDGTRSTHRETVVLSECTWQAKRGVRTSDWKYIRCTDPGVYPRDEDELYFLPDDPDEQVNLAEQRPDVVADMGGRLDAFVRQQLGSRPDPMRAVVDDGLPAVRRLELLMSGHPEDEPAPATTAARGGSG